MTIKKKLFELQDLGYKEFHSKLMPNIPKEKIIGIRVPVLKDLAKSIKDDILEFMENLPHEYYEENNLHAFLIAGIEDYDKCIYELERFLPYIDNWATCDSLRPKCFSVNKDKLPDKIREWIKSSHSYTVRFSIEMLMVHFLDDNFKKEYSDMVAAVKSDDYYVNMMIAWYFATALAKQYDSVIPYIEEKKLDKWVHNKAIQKSIESNRIFNKDYLRKLKL